MRGGEDGNRMKEEMDYKYIPHRKSCRKPKENEQRRDSIGTE